MRAQALRRSTWTALARSTWIEVMLFLREPLAVIFTLALPLIFLFVLGGVFGNTPDPGVFRGAGPLDFYLPAYVALVWAAVGLLVMPVHLARYREDGVLRRLRASPAPTWVVLGSQVVVAVLTAFVGGVLVLTAGALFFDVHWPHSATGVAGAWVLGALLFSSVGLLLSCIPSSRGALAAGLGLFFVMMMLSGTGPPPEVLSDAMRWVSDVLPLTYLVRILQSPWLGLACNAADVGVVLAMTVGGLVASMLAFRWE